MAKKSNYADSGVQGCIEPAIGALIPDYTVDLLSEDDTETVQDHLLACAHCRQRYLTVLRVRETAQQARRQAEHEATRATDGDD